MSAYSLTGIFKTEGNCDHCGRALKNLFQIRSGDEVMLVGRACCKKLTGWSPKVAQAAAIARDNRRFVEWGMTAHQVADYVCYGDKTGVETLEQHIAHGQARLDEALAMIAEESDSGDAEITS